MNDAGDHGEAEAGLLGGMLRNAGAALFGRLLAIPLEILAFALVARALRAERMGVFTFAAEFSVMFAYLLIGLGILTTRELAGDRREASARLGSLLLLFGMAGLVLYAAMLVAGWCFGLDARGLRALAIVGGANFVLAATVMLCGVFRAFGRMRHEGLVFFLQPLLYLVFVGLGLLVGGEAAGLGYMAGSLLLSGLLALAVGYVIVRQRLVRPRWGWDGGRVWAYAKAMLPLGIAYTLFSVYGRVSILFLQAGADEAALGHFNVAFRLAQNVAVIPFLLTGAWLPVLTRHAAAGGEVREGLFREHALDLYRILLAAGGMFVVVIGLLAGPVVRFLFGAAYAPSAGILQVLVWSSFLFFLNFANKTVFDAVGRQSRWLLALVLGVVACLVLSYWLVPRHGAIGAAYAVLGASMVITGVATVAALRVTGSGGFAGLLWRLAVAGAVAAVVVVALRGWSWVAAAVLGGLVYALLADRLRLVRVREWRG